MRPAYISPELYHFVGGHSPGDHEQNFEVLKIVLSSGCISHSPHEVGWGSISYTLDFDKRLAAEEMLVPTVTCYCDIPYDQLHPHLAKYGSFGLSFSRHFLTKSGCRPVTYVPYRPDDWRGVFTGHTLLKELESTFWGIHEQSRQHAASNTEKKKSVTLEARPKTLIEALQKAEHTLALRVLAFVKPFDSTLDDENPQYYYSEREWRKLGNLVFEAGDIQRVVVHHSFFDRARAELPEYQDLIVAAPRA